MLSMDDLLGALDFTEFAEMYTQTRDAEWEEAGFNLKHKVTGNGTPQSEAQAKMLSELAYSVIKESDNITLLALEKYHLWLIKKLSEILN